MPSGQHRRPPSPLSGKAESEGDHRGAIVGLREVRECLESLNGLLTKAEGAQEASRSQSLALELCRSTTRRQALHQTTGTRMTVNRLNRHPRAKLHCLQGHPLQKRRTGLALWVALFATSKECADKDRSSDGVPAGTQLSV